MLIKFGFYRTTIQKTRASGLPTSSELRTDVVTVLERRSKKRPKILDNEENRIERMRCLFRFGKTGCNS